MIYFYINQDQVQIPYYEFPNVLLNGFQNLENIMMKTETISECWNLCETNSLIKCAAISYNRYESDCYLYNSEFFQKDKFDKNNREFTTLMRKSKLMLIKL